MAHCSSLPLLQWCLVFTLILAALCASQDSSDPVLVDFQGELAQDETLSYVDFIITLDRSAQTAGNKWNGFDITQPLTSESDKNILRQTQVQLVSCGALNPLDTYITGCHIGPTNTGVQCVINLNPEGNEEVSPYTITEANNIASMSPLAYTFETIRCSILVEEGTLGYPRRISAKLSKTGLGLQATLDYHLYTPGVMFESSTRDSNLSIMAYSSTSGGETLTIPMPVDKHTAIVNSFEYTAIPSSNAPDVELVYKDGVFVRFHLKAWTQYRLTLRVSYRRENQSDDSVTTRWSVVEYPLLQRQDSAQLRTPLYTQYPNDSDLRNTVMYGRDEPYRWFHFTKTSTNSNGHFVPGDYLELAIPYTSGLLTPDCTLTGTVEGATPAENLSFDCGRFAFSRVQERSPSGHMAIYTSDPLPYIALGAQYLTGLTVSCDITMHMKVPDNRLILPLDVAMAQAKLDYVSLRGFISSIVSKFGPYKHSFLFAGINNDPDLPHAVLDETAPSLTISLAVPGSANIVRGTQLIITHVPGTAPPRVMIPACFQTTTASYNTQRLSPNQRIGAQGGMHMSGEESNSDEDSGMSSPYYSMTFTTELPQRIDCMLHSLDARRLSQVALQIHLIPPANPPSTVLYPAPFVVTGGTIDNERRIKPRGLRVERPDNNPLQHAQTYDMLVWFQILAGFILLPGDHFVISGDIFAYIHSMTCSLTSAMNDSLVPIDVHCHYSVLNHRTSHTNDDFASHLKCVLWEADAEVETYPPPLEDRFRSHIAYGDFSFYSPCKVTFLKTPDPRGWTPAAGSIHLGRSAIRFGMYAQQEHRPLDTQYKDPEDELYPFLVPDFLATEPVLAPVVGWQCEKPIAGTGISRQIDCVSPPLVDNIGSQYKIISRCFDPDSQLHVEDIVCLKAGFPKPYALHEGLEEYDDGHADNSETRSSHQVQQTQPPAQFTAPFVSHINGVMTASFVQTMSPRIASPAAMRLTQDETSAVQVYDVPIFYEDEITLAWHYTGGLDHMMDVILQSPSLPGEQEVHIGSVKAVDGAYTFTLDAIDGLKTHSLELDDVRFTLRLVVDGTSLDAIEPPMPTHYHEAVLQVGVRCLGRYRGTSNTPAPAPGHTLSSSLCENYGVCNASTGTCTCFAGFSGSDCTTPGPIDGEDTPTDPCTALECVESHARWSDESEDYCRWEDPLAPVCHCLDEYFGEQCEHQRVCEHRGCTYGRLLSPSGKPDECKCECSNAFITGSTCNQCSLPCKNGGVANTRCTACRCSAGYIGNSCQIPVWYHSFTLRNLPQHLVNMIIDASDSATRVTAKQLALLQQTFVQLLLDDYSRALRDMFIIVDDTTSNEDHAGNGSGDTSRIRVRVDLAQFKTVIPPANPNAPYVYIQLMLYPADMTDEMLAYAQQHGLNLDWNQLTNNLEFFKQFLREQGISPEDSIPVIDDPGCLTVECQTAPPEEESEESSNSALQHSTGKGLAILLIFLTLFMVMMTM